MQSVPNLDEIQFQVYSSAHRSDWDRLVRESYNGTFLHFRNYMEYHQDRFQEHSLIFYRTSDPIGILPVEAKETKLYSYRGLTYAGWIFQKHLPDLIKKHVVSLGLKYYAREGYESLELRPCPSFLCQEGEPDELYLNLGGKKVEERIFHALSLPFDKFDRGKKWGRKKAKRNLLYIQESEGLEIFWKDILVPTLWDRHQAKPVHSLEEIKLLKSRFKDQIRLFLVMKEKEVLAGSLFFIKGNVWHAQYTAASSKGRENRALDLLFTELSEFPQAGAKVLSLGTSIHQQTGLPDPLLVRWKESFGAKPWAVPVYSFDLSNFKYD